MKKLAGIILLTILGLNLLAQQDPKFSQNMFLIPSFNPGAIGQSDKICVAGAFRNQWTGLPNAPTVTTFTAHTPVNFLGRKHGVGINIMSDMIGFDSDIHLNLAYSYKTDIGAGVLGVGGHIGFINKSLTPDWYGADVIDTGGDNAIPGNGGTDFALPDIGLGVYYSTSNLYAGISSTHVYELKFDYEKTNDSKARPSMTRHYYAVAGYTIQLPNPMFEIIPSFMLQTDGRSNHIYLNTNLRYNKKFWGGVSYTVGGAATALVGIELLNGIRVGYSYDFELSPLLKYNSGSHEITIRYCFDLSLDKSPQKYESIRFL